MDRGKIVRRRIKRPHPSVWLAKNLSRACATHDVVEPLSLGERRLHLRDRWMKRRRRFHQTQGEPSSPVADLDLPPPSSTTDKLPSTVDNMLPPPHTPLSQTVVDLPPPSSTIDTLPSTVDNMLPPPHTAVDLPPPPFDKVAELPLVTVEDSKKSEDPSPTEVEVEVEVEYEFVKRVLQNYWELMKSSDISVSKLRDLDEREKVLREAIMSKGKLAASQGKSALVDSTGEIFGLSELISEKDILHSKDAYCKSLRHSLLNILRNEPVIPVESEVDVELVKQLTKYHHWNGKIYLSGRFPGVEEGSRIYHGDLDNLLDKEDI